MVDIVSKQTRSRMMSDIRSKNTRPEILVRSGLHRMGFRFRLHRKDLPGTPDLVFPKYKAVLFVHGCFFHGHFCHLFKWPKDNAKFWYTKINHNRDLDIRNTMKFDAMSWRTGIVWECSQKGKTKLPREKLLEACSRWLRSNEKSFEISGEI